jgi:hypothetical protein
MPPPAQIGVQMAFYYKKNFPWRIRFPLMS